MTLQMAGVIARASTECHLPLMKIIGVDVRPWRAIGSLTMHFLVEGPRVFVMKDLLQENEPVWQYIVRAGFSKLPYVPMKATEFPGQLPAGT